MKTLYFEGAGMSAAEISKATIGNCRIRTAFHLDNGKAVYLEMLCNRRRRHDKYVGFVDSLFYITDEEDNDDCNKHRLPQERAIDVEYSLEGILQFVNSLGASFDAVVVVPDLGGYRVFRAGNHKKGSERYYYGDEFQFDPKMAAKREAVYRLIYDMEKEELKGGTMEMSSSNFSLEVDEADPGQLHLLRHFDGYNKHWTIRTDVGDKVEDCMATATEVPLGRYGC